MSNLEDHMKSAVIAEILPRKGLFCKVKLYYANSENILTTYAVMNLNITEAEFMQRWNDVKRSSLKEGEHIGI